MEEAINPQGGAPDEENPQREMSSSASSCEQDRVSPRLKTSIHRASSANKELSRAEQ
jgi:hypothetical protein